LHPLEILKGFESDQAALSEDAASTPAPTGDSPV
jgi:hypothetical protein